MDDEESPAPQPVRVESETIGRYRLLYELGAGGMATVFLARSEGPAGFAKPVAIKRIHPHLAKSKELVDLFLDEARLASLVSHPNVCHTFDFGESDGTYYLAMEYLVGEPLNVVVRRATNTAGLLSSARWQRTLVKIVADACEGLHAAHELEDENGRPLGVVHRDVSPHNVFVTYDGAVKVLDFGVAFAADRLTKTATGNIRGKLGYLAPEQIAHTAYDRRLDVWAMGILLFEGLTGQRLFVGRTEVDTILAVETKIIQPPSSVLEAIPRELDAIVLRCLSRSPEGRYPTARALSRDLHQFLGTGGPLTNVEVGELVSELCRDRIEARTEVVAAVTEEPLTLSGQTMPLRPVRQSASGVATDMGRAHPPREAITETLGTTPAIPRPPARPRVVASKSGASAPSEHHVGATLRIRNLLAVTSLGGVASLALDLAGVTMTTRGLAAFLSTLAALFLIALHRRRTRLVNDANRSQQRALVVFLIGSTALVLVSWLLDASPAIALGAWLLAAVVSNLQMAAWGDASSAIYTLAVIGPASVLVFWPAHGFGAVAAGCAGLAACGVARMLMLARVA